MGNLVYGISPICAGLNNQRIAILGLICLAYAEGAKVEIPERLIDYTPRKNSKDSFSHPTIDIDHVFNLDKIIMHLHSRGLLTDKVSTDIIDAEYCFRVGSAVLPAVYSTSEGSDLVSDSLLALCANEYLCDAAIEAIESMGNSQFISLQLRIERDWQDYLRKRPERSDKGETTVDPLKIFKKISNSPDISHIKKILAFCDEDDLLQGKEELRATASEIGFELSFMSDIRSPSMEKLTTLQRSVLDFEICTSVDLYVGLSRSSFSNLACIIKSIKNYGPHPKHYIYNSKDECVLRRKDRGLQTDPSRATADYKINESFGEQNFGQFFTKTIRRQLSDDLVKMRRSKNDTIKSQQEEIASLRKKTAHS